MILRGLSVILRSLSWLVVLAALTGAMLLDGPPSDPAHVPTPARSDRSDRARLLVYFWADRDPSVGRLEIEEPTVARPEPLTLRWQYGASGMLRPAPRIAAWSASPERTATLAQMLQGLALADDQALEAPLRIATDLSFWTRDQALHIEGSAADGCTLELSARFCGTAILPGSPGMERDFEEDDDIVFTASVMRLSGATLISGYAGEIERLEQSWRESRRSASGLAEDPRPATTQTP